MAMSIALMSWESLHSIPVGGLAAHVSELAAALHRRHHDVHVFTRMGAGQRRYDRVKGVHYHRCPVEPDPDFVPYIERMCDKLVARLVEAEAFFDRPFDIVHAHDWLCAKALVQAKNDLHRRSVFTIHATEYGRCGNQLLEGQSRRIRDIEWEGTYVADRTICVSQALRREVGRLYSLPDEKMDVIYNGVDVRRFDASVDVDSVRGRSAIGLNDPVVLFAGRMAWQKGPDLLVEAMPGLLHYFPKAKFVFAGDGHMRAALERHVAALGMDHAARFLGHQDGQEMVGLFKSADLVCVPSRNEPFGIVILEAWSAQKPVVVTRNGGPAEFVRHQETGLIVSDTKDAIGWGVGTALANTNRARRWGRSGRREAETHFAWDRIAKETECVYQAL